jgi:hypothetical protein
MAQRRVCLDVLRGVEAGARGASRPFSSRPHNWTSSIYQQPPHTPTRTLRLPQQHTSTISATSPSSRRPFSSTPASRHEHIDPPKPGEESVSPLKSHPTITQSPSPKHPQLIPYSLRLYITFIDKDAHSHTFAVKAGDNILNIATAHDDVIEMEGACGGSCACSVRHFLSSDSSPPTPLLQFLSSLSSLLPLQHKLTFVPKPLDMPRHRRLLPLPISICI